ncbi:hypothetical protein PsYK624_050240 [Phanerochaete sordida]|uniref:DUF6534 domain-containing protein n=1 Tax=Phanerochaete sordida TaxID=48140 RepID=A0A9P3G653_9APHY|nr:hypothetical protein PsYK624_050240 [Phanerochaete sordida]
MPPAPDFELFMGPFLILVCIALMLFGVTCAQVYSYWTTYERDPVGYKILVGALWTLECTHTALCLHMLHGYFIKDIGDPSGLGNIIWSAGATIFLEVPIIALAQGFSIARIWQLSGGNVWATAVPAVFLFFRVAFGFGTATFLYVYNTWADFDANRGPFVTVNCGLTLAAVVDLMVTVILTYYLRQHKSSFRKTRYMVQKLVFYTINTGAITMVFSISAVFFFNLLRTSLMFGGVVEIICKLYANSTLALLNARQRIKEQAAMGSTGINSIPLELRGSGTASGSSGGSSAYPRTGVKIGVFKEVSTFGGAQSPSIASRSESDRKDSYSVV